jgi:predicted phosphoribosyltransferase
LIVRKLPFPDNPESGFGAIAEDGRVFIFRELVSRLPGKTVQNIIAEQQEEIERRISILRKGEHISDISERTVILTDDGLAMGSSMRTAVFLYRNRGTGKIVVAVPVSSPLVAGKFAN